MLIIENRAPRQQHHDAELKLPFELRQKSRLRTCLVSGEEVGLFMEHGGILRGGDYLQGSDGRIVLVVAADEDLMQASSTSPYTLARAAYHLGNRHVPVQIDMGWVRFQSDEVLAQMLRRFNVRVEPLTAPFEPEPGAYAGGHHHGVPPGRGGIIHEFRDFKKKPA